MVVDPRRDDLYNVVLRIRQFASDVLDGRSIQWDVPAPDELQRVKLNPEQRRHLYLILKEALTNIARHSGSGSASLAMRLEGGRITAEICDNGRGFDPTQVNGHGIENMRARAAETGGAVRVDSAVGGGVRITLELPVRRFGA